MALYLEFDRIVRRFARAKLRYAVAGGLAVGLHGYVRATQDMDFLMHKQDVPQAVATLLQLRYQANAGVQEFTRAGLTLKRFFKRLPREDDLMMVDLLIPTSARMQRVLEGAITVPFGKGSIRVVTAGDLMAMKQLRGSAIDRADIEFLRKKQ
jgi:hypothetical protein